MYIYLEVNLEVPHLHGLHILCTCATAYTLKASCEKKGHLPTTEAFIIIIFQVCKLVNEDYKRTPNFPLTITLGFCKPLIYGEQNDVGL